MKNTTTLFLIIFVFSLSFSQNKNLIGKWILDRTQFSNGNNLEINNPNYSTKTIYVISPNSLTISNQKFESIFTSNKIKTQFRTLNYVIKEGYLITEDENDDKINFFLKLNDFVKKHPEFLAKETLRNNDTIFIANDLSDYEFNNEINFDDFIQQNRTQKDRSSKSFINLNFKIEFILAKNNKIKDIKIINSIDTVYDNDYIVALKKSEKYLKNLTDKDLLITKEINNLKWAKDLNNKEEKQLYKLIENGLEYYNVNNFEKAIENFSEIKNLKIENNRFKTLIKESMINLGISYLAIGKNEEACKVFLEIGDKTDFEIRNYLIDFCSK
jgi:tetratricopeptide (TPR) repeat protein